MNLPQTTAARHALAASNVAHALQHREAVPLFFGAEHLPHLQQWPIGRSALLIETSPTRLQDYRRHTSLPLPGGVALLAGHFGPIPDTVTGSVRELIFHHDIVLVLAQLLRQLPNTLAAQQPLQLYPAGHEPYDIQVRMVVEQTLPWLGKILGFQQRSAPLCQQLRSRPKRSHIIFTGPPDEAAQCALLTRHLGDVTVSWVPLAPPDAVQTDLVLFPDGTSLAPLPTAGHAASVGYLHLLQALCHTDARWIMCRNLTMFPTEEYLLLLAPLFAATGTTLLVGLTDWLTQMGGNVVGGQYTFHLLEQLGAQTQLLTMYPEYSRRFNDTGHPLGLLPFGYTDTVPAPIAPVAHSECETDVLIAHTGRRALSDSALRAWFDGLYALGEQYPERPRNHLAHRLLLAMHHALRHLPPPLGTEPCRLLLREFDFMYYTDNRRRAIMQAVPLLRPRYRVRVIGSGWEDALPPEICEPTITDRTLLQRAYRHAGVTVLFNTMYDGGVPSPEACVCLAAGGYPLIAEPSLDPRTDTSPWPGLAPDDLPTFAQVEQLPERIAMALQDWPARNRQIATVQARWRQTIFQTQNFSLSQLLAHPLGDEYPPTLAITGADERDAALLGASLGFLAWFFEQPRLARDHWDAALTTGRLEMPIWEAFISAHLS